MAAPININANLNLNPSSINASAKQVQQALGRITGQASEFQKSLDASTARVFAFGASMAVINGVTQSFKALVSTTITVQSKLVEINSILGAGAQEFNKYRNAIFDVAKTTGQSFQTVADGAAELARQGLTATESARRLEAALVLTRISGLGSAQSVKALTAAMNGFTSAGLSAEQVVNKIVAVDTAFAVSAQDLADGFSRAGSTAEDAGVSFDELLGLITAVEQRTARGGAVIGNAFKSIFTRLSRGSTIEDLKALGVQIDATQTGVQKLQALSKALEGISDPTTASQIKELAGGVFQINVVSAALKDMGSESSIFGKATAKSFDATNEATSKNIALNEQLTAQINSLVVSVTSLGAKVGNLTFAPLLKNLLGLATTLSEGLDSALDPEKGNKFIQGLFKVIGAFIGGPGLILFTVAFAKIFKTVLKFAGEGFKTVMQMGSATEKIKNIEGGIVGLLQKDVGLRKILASTTATQAQKEQAVIKAIQRENALLTQQQALVRNIAAMTAQRGVTGYSPGGGFSGKKGKRYSDGGGGIMEPDLETAMINEARDSPRGASPFVTQFRGNPAVMNTSETQVRIGGREEILTAQQANELIPRYKKGSKRKGRPVSTKDYAYLVPKVGVRATFGGMTHDGIKYGAGAPIRGPRQNAIEGASDNSEANLEGSVTKNIINSASKWTEKLKPLGRVAKYNDVRRGFDTTAGAKGGLKAAIGGAFEVAISRSLGYEAATREKGGDFDVRGGRNLHRVQNLFGISQRIADFKVSTSDGNKRSFLSKIRKEKGVKKDGKNDKNVSQKELNRAAANKARLNVKNRYGNDKKFQKGTTIPLREHKEAMEKAIEKETARLKRDVYHNAHSGFTNKNDRTDRKARNIYKPISGSPGVKKLPMIKGGRYGRNSKGSLSTSKLNNLKRYRAGSLINLGKKFFGKGKGKGKGGDEGGGGGFGMKDAGMMAAFSAPGMVGNYMSQNDQMDNSIRQLGEAKETLKKNPKDKEAADSVKQIEENIKTLEATGSGMGDYAKSLASGFAFQFGIQKFGSLVRGGRDLATGAGNMGRQALQGNAFKKTRIPAAFAKKTKAPISTTLPQLQKINKGNTGIDRARKFVGKKLSFGAGGLLGALGLQMAKDPVADALKTSGGQDTAGSVLTRATADAGSYALSAPGPAKIPAAAFGFLKSFIDQGKEAFENKEFQENEGLRLDDFRGALKDRSALEASFGLTGGKMSGRDHKGVGYSMAAREAGTDGPKNLGQDDQGRSLSELRRLYGGNSKELEGLLSKLKQGRNTYADVASDFGRNSLEFGKAANHYGSLLSIREHLMDNADAMSEHRASLAAATKELSQLAKGSLSGFIARGEASAVKTKDRGDFLGAMTGPNMENAKLLNKVSGVFTGLLNDENRMLEMPNQSAVMQKLPVGAEKSRRMAEEGIEPSKGKENEAIAAHFKKKVEEAGKIFTDNVRQGAKNLIMERIAITERIKSLQADKRELTGGIDPNTNKPIQGSINTKGVSEIVTGTSQGPIDAGRVRSIVENMKEAKESGDMDKFKMAMTNLKGELNGRLEGNEDKVLDHFGFSLDDKKNKAFFDKARTDSVVKKGTGGNYSDKQGNVDTGFIMGLGGSGRDEERAGDIDKDIDKAKERGKYLDGQIGKLGDQFGKEIVDELQKSAEYARAMADGLLKSAESTSGLVDVAAAVDKLRAEAQKIIQKDAKRIAELGGQINSAEFSIKDIQDQLVTLGGEPPAPAPTPPAEN